MAEAVFPLVRKIAEQNDSHVILFHVTTPMDAMYYGSELMAASVDLEHTLRVQANTYLQHTLSAWVDRGLKAVAVLKDAPKVPAAITAYAIEHGVDLIAMSTHGRSGLDNLLVGGVAVSVLHLTQVPVLMVHPDET